jgi:lipopolysaccharide export system protein LptC
VYSVQDPAYLATLEARFAVAARHSRRVRFLRKAIPSVIAISMLAIVGVSVFNPFRMLTNLPLQIGNLNVSGTRITMEQPRLAGFTPDRRPYELQARTASQDITRPDFMELEDLKAKVEMEDKSIVLMDARKGFFNNKDQMLDLKDNIFLKSSTGYEARLSEARVDIAKGNVLSEKPVAVKLLNGTLDAKRLEITENGALLKFTGGVTMHLVLDDPAAAPQAAGVR